jgi:ketosteroid isomerase-like protein
MDNAEIARTMYRAFAAKDRATVEKLLADGFHFTSPLDNRLDRATFFHRCWPNSERIRAFDFVRVAAAGEEVVVTYEGHSTDGGRFRNTEVLTIRAGQIHDAEVYFGWSIPHEAKPGGFVDKG